MHMHTCTQAAALAVVQGHSAADSCLVGAHARTHTHAHTHAHTHTHTHTCTCIRAHRLQLLRWCRVILLLTAVFWMPGGWQDLLSMLLLLLQPVLRYVYSKGCACYVRCVYAHSKFVPVMCGVCMSTQSSCLLCAVYVCPPKVRACYVRCMYVHPKVVPVTCGVCMPTQRSCLLCAVYVCPLKGRACYVRCMYAHSKVVPVTCGVCMPTQRSCLLRVVYVCPLKGRACYVRCMYAHSKVVPVVCSVCMPSNTESFCQMRLHLSVSAKPQCVHNGFSSK